MTTLTIEIPEKSEKTLADLIEQLGGKVIKTNEKKSVKAASKKQMKGVRDEGIPYNPEFVAKIEKSIRQANEGKVVKIALDDIWK